MANARKMRILDAFKSFRSKSAYRSKKFVSKLPFVAKTFFLTLIFYTFSIGLTFYNKKIVKHFRLPLSMTIVHLVAKFIAASCVRSFMERCSSSKKERVTLSWCDYIKRLALPGIFSGIDIGLSNWSFEFITVSLYTMTKSSSVIFVLCFSICFKLEKFASSLIVIVALISGGLFLFTYKSTQFEWHGFVLVMVAAILSGLRWTLAQLVLQKKQLGLSHPVDMMYHIQPWMLVGILPLAFSAEGLQMFTSHYTFHYDNIGVVMTTLGLTLLGGAQAFFLELSEFLLLYYTSSLTLTIAGIIKEICTLYIAYEFTGDHMTLLNGVGLVICLIGITCHVILKYRHNRIQQEADKTTDGEDMEMLLQNNVGGGAQSSDDESDDVELFNARLVHHR